MMNQQPMPQQMTQNPEQQDIAQQQPQMDPEEQKNLAAVMIQKIQEAHNLARMPSKLKDYMGMANIADELDKKELDDIANLVIESTDNDESSRSEWKELIIKVTELIDSNLKGKSYPWEGAANVKFPMVMGSCVQFNARTMPEIIKNDKVVAVRNMSPDDPKHTKCKRADDLAAHMSYQLLGQSDHWVMDTDQLLMMLPLYGIVFRKSFYNSIIKQPDTKLVSPLDVIVNMKATSLESAQRITHKFTMSANEIIENMNAGLFIEYSVEELMQMSNSEDQVNSFTTDDELKNAFYDQSFEIYEQHRYLDLDGDGYQEPYIVTVLEGARKTLRIVARYDENSIEYNAKDKMTKINPIQYWTDYRFIPNPAGGFYSLGFGSILFATNSMANSIINQLIDAGTLSNMQGGFISRNLRLPKGDFSFKPGELKQVNTTPGSSIAENIFMLPIKEPSQVLFTLLNFIIDSSRAITAISDVMQGDLPPSSTPAATTMALIEQGQKIYSAILYRLYNSLQKEFIKLYNINKKYMQNEEQFPLAIGSGMVSIDDYKLPNYGIFPVADPQLSSSMQRLLQSQALMQVIQDPRIDGYAVLHNYLEALKVPNIDEILPPPDPNKPPPIDLLLKEADLQNKKMETACMLMDRELKAISVQIEEANQKSKTAYYGVQAATQKIDSIVKLVQLQSSSTPEQIEQATKEEEALTESTQFEQSPTPDITQNLQQLESEVQKMISGLNETVSQDQGLAPQEPPSGNPAEAQLTPQQIAELSGQMPMGTV